MHGNKWKQPRYRKRISYLVFFIFPTKVAPIERGRRFQSGRNKIAVENCGFRLRRAACAARYLNRIFRPGQFGRITRRRQSEDWDQRTAIGFVSERRPSFLSQIDSTESPRPIVATRLVGQEHRGLRRIPRSGQLPPGDGQPAIKTAEE